MAVPVLLGLGIVLGLAREVVFASVFGAGMQLDIFRIAYSLPSFFSQSVGSAFVAGTVPWLVRLRMRNPAAQKPLFRLLARTNAGMVALIGLLALASVPLQIHILAPGFHAGESTAAVHSARLCWIMFLISGLSFSARAELNAAGVYWPGAIVPAIRNGSLALVLPFLLLIFPRSLEADASTLSWLVIGGGILVLSVHVLPMTRLYGGMTGGDAAEAIGRVLPVREMAASVASVLFFQVCDVVPRFLDRGYASAMGVGAVSNVEYGYSVLIAVGVVFGTAFTTVFLPKYVVALERAAKLGDLKRIGSSAAVVIGIAAILGMALATHARSFTALVFMRGAFDRVALDRTASVMDWQALGMGGYVAGLVFSNGLIGLGLKRGLFFAGTLKVMTRVVALQFLVPAFGLPGIGMSYAITETCTAIVTFALLRSALNARFGGPPAGLEALPR